jgi:hypothetical protein
MPDTADPQPLPGRACGSCNVCCVALTIDDPALRKVQGYRCPNTLPDHGCAIYEARPNACRSFFCGWRLLKWVPETLRPDTSGVLVGLTHEGADAQGQPRRGVTFTLLSGQALKAEGLAETVAAAVAAGIAVYLRVPGPPGYTSSTARINDVLAHAVLTRDKPGVLRVLREARARGRRGAHRPILLDGAVGGGDADPTG